MPHVRFAVILILLPVLSPRVVADTEIAGQFGSGAYWHIRVPDGWAPGDGLVLWNHGFDLDAPSPEPDLGPLADLQVEQGYAVAATSYRGNGWALFDSISDLRDLAREFDTRFGTPERTYLAGGSLGGLVSVQGAEAAGLDGVAGTYSLCGALGGSRLWDAALDLRLAYDAVCKGVSGASIPGGAKGLPYRLHPEDYGNEDLTSVLAAALGHRIDRCTGVLSAPEGRSAQQQQRLERLMSLLDIPNESFFLLNMAYATFGLADLVRDPDKLDGDIGSGNAEVDYDNAQLDSAIERVAAGALDRQRLLTNYSPTGKLEDARVLALHTDGDGLVPVENLADYRARAPADRLSTAVVKEDEPSHCGFTPAEVVAGWNALTDWVERDAPQPDAETLQERCRSLVAGGAQPGPCRIASADGVESLDAVARPRNVEQFRPRTGSTGAWFDPERDGEGWALEILPDDRAVVYWFTYPPAGGQGSQQWFIGTGEVEGNHVRVDVLEPRGPPFGETQPPVALAQWGTLDFAFADCDSALVRWVGPVEYGVDQRQITRLSEPFACDGETGGFKSSPLPPVDEPVTGSWYDPAFDGSGLHVQQLADGRVLLYWFTYDGDGRPAWIIGTGGMLGGTLTTEEAFIPRGARFGGDFRPSDVELVPFGELGIGFDDCDSGRLLFDSGIAAFGEGERHLERLTLPAGPGCPEQ